MGLAIYKKKRHFDRTPEPGPKLAHTDSRHAFVIQKHAASHLHYDFRLELDGTLKSWAVPKGPSLDPGEKRLAMQVEDHPVSYRDFEGIIPKGEYGGGTVIVWDKGTWTPHGDAKQMLEKGRLSFELDGEKLSGGFALVKIRGKDDEKATWLLMKSKDAGAKPGSGSSIVDDEPASVLTGRTIDDVARDAKSATWHSNRTKTATKKPAHRSAKRTKVEKPRETVGTKERMPDFSPPALATLVSAPPEGDGWLHEVKYDGYRALVHVRKGKATVFTRSGQDWTERFSSIAEAAAKLPVDDAIFDGEIVSLRADGISDFGALQNAMGAGGGGSLQYFVFDLLHLDGRNLRDLPLRERKTALEGVIERAGDPPLVRLSKHIEGSGQKVHDSACKMGLEGIVSKRADAPYVDGRGKTWLKSKCQKRQELVVGGFTDPEGGRTGIGALLVGYHDREKGFVYAGKVGTGFDHQTLTMLRDRLGKAESDEPPFVDPPRGRGIHWVRPQVVVEIEFTEWTKDGKLRHPSFQGLREDKKAKDVRREMPVDRAASKGSPTPSRSTKSPAADTKPARRSSSKTDDDTLEVAGVRITHASKLLYPDEGVTKGDVALYYEKIADHVLPHLRERPLTIVRCPEGYAAQCFYQKHPGAHAPASLRRIKVNPKEDDYAYVDSLEGLIALVQMGVLELHVWGSHAKTFEKPDLLVMDLDPDEGLGWEHVAQGARDLRDVLAHVGLTSFVKTTGGKGLHVVVPIRPKLEWSEVKDFTKSVADTLVRLAPDRYTANMSKAKRRGKIFVDYLRNGRGATAVTAYSTRARPGATVAFPISWDDLDDVKPAEFTTKTVPLALERRKNDPWQAFFETRQTITAKMVRTLEKALRAEDTDEAHHLARRRNLSGEEGSPPRLRDLPGQIRRIQPERRLEGRGPREHRVQGEGHVSQRNGAAPPQRRRSRSRRPLRPQDLPEARPRHHRARGARVARQGEGRTAVT